MVKYIVIQDADFVAKFGEEFTYVSNTSRLLDALQMYLHGCRTPESCLEDLWDLNFDECREGDNCYIPASAVEDISKFFMDFEIYGATEIFKIA